MKFFAFALTLLFFLVHPLKPGVGQTKTVQPDEKNTIPVTELKNKILANLDTIKANYKEKIADLKTPSPAKKIYTRKKPEQKKLIVTPVPLDSSSLTRYVATDGTFLKATDSISTEAPKLKAPKRQGFFKRLFKKRK